MYRRIGTADADRGPFNAFAEHEIGTCAEATIGAFEKTRRTMSMRFMQLHTQSIEQFQFGDCQFSAEPDQQRPTVKHRFWYLKTLNKKIKIYIFTRYTNI